MSIPFTWLYIIHDEFTGLYKIGRSDNPAARLKELSKAPGTVEASPKIYTLIEAYLAPLESEKQFHSEWADLRVRGEWFQLDDDCLAEIRYRMHTYERWGKDESHAEENEQELIQQCSDLFNKYRTALLALKDCGAVLTQEQQADIDERETEARYNGN